MFPILSTITSVKDYVEVINKLIETDWNLPIISYNDWGAIWTYIALITKKFCWDLISLNWIGSASALPTLIPDIASAMVSEISVLDGYFHNAYTFLETPISYGNGNLFVYCLEKLTIGLVNSFFLFLPTSVAHIICLRRFIIQGVEAGYISGLGTLTGNLFWIASVIFGWRFIVIPWLSLDILRYFIGIMILLKYIWDSYNERKTVLEDLSKLKIFLFNFGLAFTEQSSLFPFVGNISLGSDSTALESFPTTSFSEFILVHSFYLLGLLLGGLSFLYFSCWFWENPAFRLYNWVQSSFKLTSGLNWQTSNLIFLYLTIVCAMSNMTYFGFDYLLTKGPGFVSNDRVIDQKNLLETSFLGTKASDRNTRRNIGHRSRRERWKRRVRRYRTFDASLYDQGIYDLFTIEDLNYGFDRFWLRRKIRNLRLRFRLFPGPWMKSLKQLLTKSKLESLASPRLEFFRNLKEEAYHPSFHEKTIGIQLKDNSFKNSNINPSQEKIFLTEKNLFQQKRFSNELATLRKFIRKGNLRTKKAKLAFDIQNPQSIEKSQMIYSKRWKEMYSKLNTDKSNWKIQNSLIKTMLNNKLTPSQINTISSKNEVKLFLNNQNNSVHKKTNFRKHLSEKDEFLLKYRAFLQNSKDSIESKHITLFHPLKYFLGKEKAFQKKMKYYGANIYRNFTVENNSPYYRIMTSKYFYYYKPTKRWESTMKGATLRMARRKSSRIVQRLKSAEIERSIDSKDFDANANLPISESNQNLQKPTHMFSILGKRATRYRHQIYKDVLQHWYYSPFNRLLLKFDVDNFIRRQPYNYFLTKKEEKLLQTRRYLLSEYYETLRWYTSMQHYRSMKMRIGGTKSFSSRFYNQQFYGTFKKIRHLFSITPSLGDNTVLKFDQPLYNEYANNKNLSILNDSLIHEELVADEKIWNRENNSLNLPENLVNKSENILKEYLTKANPVRQDLIEKYLKEDNNAELTKFLVKGQKTRGFTSITNNQHFIDQEKSSLLSEREKFEFNKKEQEKIAHFLKNTNFSQQLWINLLKKFQNQLYDRQAIKEYLSYRVEKREKRKRIAEKNLKDRLQRIQTWILNKKQLNLISNTNNISTGISKGLKEAIENQKSITAIKSKLGHKKVLNTTSLRKVTTKLQQRLVSDSENLNKIESNVQQSLQSVKSFLTKNKQNVDSATLQKFETVSNFVNKTIYPLKKLVKKIQAKVSNNSRTNNITKISKILKTRDPKDLDSWKQKQRLLTRRKQTRKVLKRLKRKERVTIKKLSKNEYFIKNEPNLEQNKEFKLSQIRQKRDLKEPWDFLNLTSDFQTKRSRRRGARRMRARAPIQKATLNEKLKRQFRLFKRYGEKIDKEKREVFQFLNRTKYSPEDEFQTKVPKQRRPRQRENRYWRKHKKPKYAQNKRKLRKRKRYAISKIRSLAKSLHRTDINMEIQRWWWSQFLPNLQAKTNIAFENEGRKEMLSKISQMKLEEILKRDEAFYKGKIEEVPGANQLQIGNYDYKPLSIPIEEVPGANQLQIGNYDYKPLSIPIEEVPGANQLQIGNYDYKPLSIPEALKISQNQNNIKNKNVDDSLDINKKSSENQEFSNETLKKISANLFLSQKHQQQSSTELMQIANPIPFYAGWDETLRKFVITNRLLSRSQAGYKLNEVQTQPNLLTQPEFQNLKSNHTNDSIEFQSFPLKGMNVATTLYWQIPFTTYDPDQFFTLGRDGFAPIGWKRFQFQYSKQTIKPILKNEQANSNHFIEENRFESKIQNKILKQQSKNNQAISKTLNKFIWRRLQKRNKRIKSHPRLPSSFPSGPLANEVLPVHYIYVFYKRSRLPRDRYITRRFRNLEDGSSYLSSKLLDFTLRRRVKTRRKYHRKPSLKQNVASFPRRRAWRKSEKDFDRPSSTQNLLTSQQSLLNVDSKGNNLKDGEEITKPENLRIRQLKSRTIRQRIRPAWRYRPRAGGFVWPGDYLRFEMVTSPADNLLSIFENQKKFTSQSTKNQMDQISLEENEIPNQEWQPQPKKYLIQKHNLNIMKRRLQKSQNQHKLQQKIQELNSLLIE